MAPQQSESDRYAGLGGLVRYLRNRRAMRRLCAAGHAFGDWGPSVSVDFPNMRECRRCHWREFTF